MLLAASMIQIFHYCRPKRELHGTPLLGSFFLEIIRLTAKV